MAATQLARLETHSAMLAQASGSSELSDSRQHPLGPSITSESLRLCQPAQQEVTQHLAFPVSHPDSSGHITLEGPEHWACPAAKHTCGGASPSLTQHL